MSADKRYTVIIEDARLFRIAPIKANQIFVKIYLEGSKKGKETKAAQHDGDKFVFINESAEIEVDSRVSTPTVVIVKVMQTGMFKSSKIGKLKIKLPDVLPFERIPVKPNELTDRHGEVIGTIGVYLMLKSVTGNYMAIQRKKLEPVAMQEPELALKGPNMLSCTTFASMDSSMYGSVSGPPSEASSKSSSRASHVLMCGQPPQSLMREGALVHPPVRREMLQRSPLRQGRSLPPVNVRPPHNKAVSDATRMETAAMPLDRNITHNSNETMSSMQSRGSAQSRASISHFSTTSTEDYPLSPAADPPKYLPQRQMEIDAELERQLEGSQSLPSNISVAASRFPPINNLPDEPIDEASMYSAPRFPDMGF